MCIFSFYGCKNVKIEHTLAGHNHDILQQCIFDVHASRSMGPKLPTCMLLSIETYLNTRKIKEK